MKSGLRLVIFSVAIHLMILTVVNRGEGWYMSVLSGVCGGVAFLAVRPRDDS